MAAVVRPPSQPGEDASPALTRPSRQRVQADNASHAPKSTIENCTEEFRRERALSQASGKSSETSESRLDTVLRAIAGVRESVDERFALMQEAITERSDIEQIKETVSDELNTIVQKRLKITVQRTIVDATREEVTKTVQQQVSEVVCQEVKSVIQHEVTNIVTEKVAATIQQQITSVIKQQVTRIVQQQVTSIVQQQVTSTVRQQVTRIVQQQVSLSSRNRFQPSLKSSYPAFNFPAQTRRMPMLRAPHRTVTQVTWKTLSNQTTPSTLTDTLYCTVDVSSVEEGERGRASASTIRQEIEEGMRNGEGGSGWRCVAVTRDPRNTGRIRITCRDEDELACVKAVAERTKAIGSRVLRDQWYQVKMDNACRTAVLDKNGELRAGATEMIEKENDVKIDKMSWLIRKDSPKAYGSMVVYMTKRTDAARLLEGK